MCITWLFSSSHNLSFDDDLRVVMAGCWNLLQSAERQKGTADFLSGMGLGMLAGPLKDLNLGELLNTAPPGLDEGVAIAKASCSSHLLNIAERLITELIALPTPGRRICREGGVRQVYPDYF